MYAYTQVTLQNAADILSYLSSGSLQLLIWRAPLLSRVQDLTGVEDRQTGRVTHITGGKSN